MKTVYIMRHAVSGPARHGADDIDRTLTDRGREIAQQVGHYMAREKMSPDAALVSAAGRTVETWQCVSGSAGWSVKPEVDRKFYLASDRIWLNALGVLGPQSASVLLVGHHPGVDALALKLAGKGAPTAMAEMAAGFPTAALAELSFDCSWGEIDAGRGTLLRFVTPRYPEG